MEYRQLGSSGLKVPILTFGTGTFGGQTDFFKPWGASDVQEATRLVDVCLDAGLTTRNQEQLTQNLDARVHARSQLTAAASAGRPDT